VECFVRFILLFLVFIRPFSSGLSEPSSNWFSLIILSLLLILHLIRIIEKRALSYSTRLDFPLLLFSISLIIGLFNSFSRNCAISETSNFLSYFLLFFLIIHYPPKEGWLRFFILISSFLVSLYGIYQSLFGFSQTREWILKYSLSNEFLSRISPKRVFSTFIYPNSFAGYLVLIIPLVISGLLGKKKIFIPLSLPILYSLYLTGSRGGFISFFFSLFLFTIIRKKRILTLISLFLFLLVLIYYCLPPPSSLIARLSYARASIKIIKDHPAGTGLSTFADMYFRYKLPEDEETRMAHNNYLQIGVELGIFGLLTFVLLLIFIIVRGLNIVRKHPYLEGYYIGSLTFFFHSLVDFDLYLPEITFCLFFFIGILFSFERKEKSPNRLFYFFLIFPIIYLCFFSLRMFVASSFYEKAISHSFKNEYRLMEKNLENAIRLNKNPEWLILLGRIKEEKDITESLRLYRMAISENPNCAYYNFCVARALVKRGENKEAILFLKRALALYPTSPFYKNLAFGKNLVTRKARNSNYLKNVKDN